MGVVQSTISYWVTGEPTVREPEPHERLQYMPAAGSKRLTRSTRRFIAEKEMRTALREEAIAEIEQTNARLREWIRTHTGPLQRLGVRAYAIVPREAKLPQNPLIEFFVNTTILILAYGGGYFGIPAAAGWEWLAVLPSAQKPFTDAASVVYQDVVHKLFGYSNQTDAWSRFMTYFNFTKAVGLLAAEYTGGIGVHTGNLARYISQRLQFLKKMGVNSSVASRLDPRSIEGILRSQPLEQLRRQNITPLAPLPKIGALAAARRVSRKRRRRR